MPLLHGLGGMILGVDLFQVVDGDMGIDLGGFQGFMAQHLLQMSDGSSIFEHVSCTGVAEGMGCDVLFKLGCSGTLLDDPPYGMDF